MATFEFSTSDQAYIYFHDKFDDPEYDEYYDNYDPDQEYDAWRDGDLYM